MRGRGFTGLCRRRGGSYGIRRVKVIDALLHSSLSKGCRSSTIKSEHFNVDRRPLQDLLEGTVDGRAHGGALVEVDGGNGALANALGGELEFLRGVSVFR